MDKIIVTGCGTGVGKTVVAAILALALGADYWKPVECDKEESDSGRIRKWLPDFHTVHSPSYSFKAPLSPHHAARLENQNISIAKIKAPSTNRPLIMETAGGLLVPLNSSTLSIDLFRKWEALWVVVSRHYLGSINHTLLTLKILKAEGICPLLVFNGDPNPDTEHAIENFSKTKAFGRLSPEPNLSLQTLEKYAELWKTKL